MKYECQAITFASIKVVTVGKVIRIYTSAPLSRREEKTEINFDDKKAALEFYANLINILSKFTNR